MEKFLADFYQNLIFEDRYLVLLSGMGVTLQVTVFALLFGTFMGFVSCMFTLSNSKVLKTISRIYVDIIRGTPLIVQLLIFYFIVFGSVNIDKVIVAVFAFGFNSGAYVSEILRSGILSVDKGQTEAGRSLGLNEAQTLGFIIMPQAIKNILPVYINEVIVMIKETAVVGYIALVDLTKAGDMIRSRTFNAFFPLITVATIYFVVIKILSVFLHRVELRLRRSDH